MAEETQDALFGPLPGGGARRRRRAGAAAVTDAGPDAVAPTALVAVDVPHPHLDHPFTYLVPPALREAVRAGVRVVVPFAGQQHDGWVLDVGEGPVAGLRPLRRVVGTLPVLTEEVAALARAVADDLAGTLPDVLRSAVPPRHATAEREVLGGPDGESGDEAGAGSSDEADAASGETLVDASAEQPPSAWAPLVGGAAFLDRLAAGEGPRAAVRPALSTGPGALVAEAVGATRASGRGTVVVVPDVTAVGRVLGSSGLADDERTVVLHHELGPAARWRAFVTVLTGRADVVVGTRSAVFAPLAAPGLCLVLDDGDDGHVEPHAPGWDSGLVALLRAERSGAGLALVSAGRTARAQQWVADGRLRPLAPPRQVRRRTSPRVVVPSVDDPLEATARVPGTALRVAREALQAGPVLVQVPRAGWVTSLRCRTCRSAVRCRHCQGPLRLAGADGAPPACGWCARPEALWRCPACGDERWRAGTVGAGRSAEELGRAFPRTPVVLSRAGQRRAGVGPGAALVVATPGAEPVAAGGYAAGLVLDGDLALARPGLAVEEETLRRWCEVAALVRPAEAGGRLVVVADPTHRVVQALVQDAPELLADRLLAERTEAGLPPVRALVRLTGTEADLAAVAATLRGEDVLVAGPALPDGLRVLGPAPADREWQLLVTGPRPELLTTVRDLLVDRSAAKAPGRLTVRVDPHDLV